MLKNKVFVFMVILFCLLMIQSANKTNNVTLNTYLNRHWLNTLHEKKLNIQTTANQLKKVKIGIIDSGFKTNGTLQNIEFLSSTNYSSKEEHGDVVASIIGTKTSKENIGLLPNIKIYAYNIPKSDLNSKSLAKAINIMKENHIDIVNISLNTYKKNSELKHAIISAIDHGMLIVCSAGNSGTNLLSYPASYDIPGLISVGSINSELNVTSFSTDNSQVTVFAPGEGVQAYNVNSRNIEKYSGTSVSAPFVTVLAFLIKIQDSSLSPSQIETRIVKGADYYLGTWQYKPVRIRLINFQNTLN